MVFNLITFSWIFLWPRAYCPAPSAIAKVVNFWTQSQCLMCNVIPGPWQPARNISLQMIRFRVVMQDPNTNKH